jgi:poly(3-hydroxybutyrate) depolymerase
MVLRMHWTVGIAMLLCASAAAQVCNSNPGTCQEKVLLGAQKSLTVYRNLPLTVPSNVRRAVIMIHGTKRDGDRYFEMLEETTRAAGELPHTLLIAPVFRSNDGEGCQDSLGSDELEWPCNEWKYGAKSLNDVVDSYTALDRLIRRLADRKLYPKLERIVVAGHSAGGQFVQRYSAGTQISVPGVEIRFVIANPSSYMYFIPERPFSAAGCEDTNRYRYGLDGRTGYMGVLSAEDLARHARERDIRYLAGGEDIAADDTLDVSCAARAQGSNRRERASQFVRLHGWPERLNVIPGCAHQSGCIFSSEAGREALFGPLPPRSGWNTLRSGPGLE